MANIHETSDCRALHPAPPELAECMQIPPQPVYLNVGQHILDQPPYTLLFDLFPQDFFVPRQKEGVFRFLKSLGKLSGHVLGLTDSLLRQIEEGRFAKNMLQQWYHIVRPEYRKKDQQGFFGWFQTIDTALAPYPGVYQYLFDKQAGFGKDGSPRVPEQPAPWYRPEITFAAYQHEQFKGEELGKFFGIVEGRPAGYSDGDDVVAALPPKGPTNRTFRLLFSSNALR